MCRRTRTHSGSSMPTDATPATVADVLPPPTSAAATAVGEPAPAPLPCAPRVRYIGVQQSPCGRWTAHVLDPDHGAVREIGAFPDEHAAALAHDRVAVAFHGDGARLNFKPAFHAIELQFLLLCRRTQRSDLDVCAMVADGTYEARYASFLREVFELERHGEYLDVILEFFIDRAAEIGEEALTAGGEKLADRFVAMHLNRAVDPAWRGWYHRKIVQCIAERQRQQQEIRGAPAQRQLQQ